MDFIIKFNLFKIYMNTLTELDNGRVVNIHEKTYKPVYMTDDNSEVGNNEYKDNAVINIQTKTPLSDVFFSQANIDNLQIRIRHDLYLYSEGSYTIDRQSDTELKIIMRSYYLQFGKFKSCDLRSQVLELNDIVIQYCVPHIYSQVQQYNSYIQDVETLPMPLEHPKNLSSTGSRNLRSVTTTF